MKEVIGSTVDVKGNFRFVYKEQETNKSRKTNKVNVVKAFEKLPYEAQLRIEVVLGDDNLKLQDVTIQYLIDDVKWTIYMMEVDMGDHYEYEEEYKNAEATWKACKKWMNYYKRYDIGSK